MYVDAMDTPGVAPRPPLTRALGRMMWANVRTHWQFWDSEVGRAVHVGDMSRTPIVDAAVTRPGSHIVVLTSTGVVQYVSVCRWLLVVKSRAQATSPPPLG